LNPTKPMKISVVVPITPDVDVKAFMDAWAFSRNEVIFVVDGALSDHDLSSKMDGLNYYAWDEIDSDLGSHAWIISRKTSAIRSYGYWKAWQQGADVILTLDSDCFPINTSPEWLYGHLDQIRKQENSDCWLATGSRPTRGMPCLSTGRDVEIKINHGMWENVPDEDAIQKMVFRRIGAMPDWSWQSFVVPRGYFYSQCGMNLSWAREVTPLMYFGLQGQGWPYDRFDDIWAGIFAKKICDHLNYGIRTGTPAVDHRHRGDILKNFQKEQAGIVVNETLWKTIDRYVLTSDTVMGCCRELTNAFDAIAINSGYFQKLKEAYNLWLDLFETKSNG